MLLLKEMFGNSPLWGTIMVILLPYFESARLKNGSVITSKHLVQSCSINAHGHTGQWLEENEGVIKPVQPTPCFEGTKESLRNYIRDASETLGFD